MSIFAAEQPTFAATLELRAERQAMVRDFSRPHADLLAETRPAAWWPEQQVPSCTAFT